MMASPPVCAKLHMYPLIFSKPSKVQGVTYKESMVQDHNKYMYCNYFEQQFTIRFCQNLLIFGIWLLHIFMVISTYCSTNSNYPDW